MGHAPGTRWTRIRTRAGRGPGGGRRRPLDHGDLRLLILKLISEEPRHGYEMIREIEARTGGAYVPSPGVIYRRWKRCWISAGSMPRQTDRAGHSS
jgi:hypothetical protein